MQRVVPAEQRSEVMAQFVRCVKDSGYSSIGESDSRATIDEKVARITDPAMRGKVEVCLGRFAGLWPETIA